MKNKYSCPYCRRKLSDKTVTLAVLSNEIIECKGCGHYLRMEDGKLRLPEYRNE